MSKEELQPKVQPEVELDTDGIKDEAVELPEEKKVQSETPDLNKGEVDLGYQTFDSKSEEKPEVEEIQEETSDNSIEWSLFTDDIEKELLNINSNDVKDIEVVDYEVVVGDSYVSDEFEIEKDHNDDLLFPQDINVSESLLNEDIDVQTKLVKEPKSEEKKDKNLVNSPISDFQKQRSDERKLRMKEFNYKFNKSKIEDLVEEPAYKRKGIKFNHDNSNEDNNISRTSISLDENNDTKIRKNNSFLHDNVD